MQGEVVLNKRRTWWRSRVAVPLGFATLLTQLALVPFAPPAARALQAACTADAVELRADIASADFGATVVVEPGIYYLTGGPLTISKDITVVGTGATSAHVVIDACRSSRVFDVVSSTNDIGRVGEAQIENLQVTGGQTQSGKNGGGIRGGGVQVLPGASLKLVDVHIFDNDATEGGGLYNGGSTRLDGTTGRRWSSIAPLARAVESKPMEG